MKWLQNRLSILGIMLIFIAAGCSLIPGSNSYSTPDASEIQQKLIFSRYVEPESEVDFSSGSFLMRIPKGAVEKSILLQIKKTPVNFTSLGLEENFVQISDLYSLLVPEDARLLKTLATISFAVPLSIEDNTLFVAEKNSGEWRFLPFSISGSQISIVFGEFSEFVVLKKKALQPETEDVFPELRIIPEEIIIEKGHFASESIKIEILCHENGSSKFLPGDRQIEISAPEQFELAFINSDELISTRKSSSLPHRMLIDLHDAELVEKSEDSSRTSYRLEISLKEQDKDKFPEFMKITAGIKDENGIVRSVQKTIAKKYVISDPDGTSTTTQTSTSTGTSTQTPTETQTQTSTGTSTQTPTETQTQTSTGTSTQTPTETQTQTSTVTATEVFTKITEVSPAAGSGIKVNNSWTIKFDQTMNRQKAEAATTLQPTHVPGLTFQWSDSDRSMTVVPSGELAFATTYLLKVASTAESTSGNRLQEDFSGSFTTSSQTILSSTIPADQQNNVATNTTIEMRFSREVSSGSVTGRVSVSSGSISISGSLAVNSDRIIFTPDNALPWGSTISVNLAAGIKDLEGFSINLPRSFSFKTAVPVFSITSSQPADGSSELPVTQTTEIIFSNPVNTSSLAYSYLPAPSGGVTLTWSNGNRTLSLTPTNRLSHSQTYQVTINTATRDVYGSNLQSAYSTSFTTRAAVNPVISSTVPAAGSLNVMPDQPIKLTFSKTMQRTATQNAITLNPAAAGSMAFSWSENDTILTISFSQPLTNGVSYQLKVSSSAADTEELKLAGDYLLSFTTTARPAVLITKSSPASGSVGVVITSPVKVEFSKSMNTGSAQSAFKLIKIADQSEVSGNFSWNGNIMTFTPQANLGFYSSYLISVAASAADTTGTTLETKVEWQFRTAADEGRVWRLDQADTAASSFSQRRDHVMISFNNRLWVIAGHDEAAFFNDVWSSADGISWTKEVSDGAAGMFARRAGHACAVFNNRLWLSGGYVETETDDILFDDVWSSADGRNWVQETASAEYYSRAWHKMVAYDSKLWIIGGETVDGDGNKVLLDECWSSANGVAWQIKSQVVSFFARKQMQCTAFNGRLWVFGGYGKNSSGSVVPLNDIWSTVNGDTWTLEKSNGGFAGRCSFGMTQFNGRIWLAGGSTKPEVFDAGFYNDVWASNDGLNWVEILPGSAGSAEQFSPRSGHELGTVGGRLFIGGGGNRTQNFREVWSTQ